MDRCSSSPSQAGVPKAAAAAAARAAGSNPLAALLAALPAVLPRASVPPGQACGPFCKEPRGGSGALPAPACACATAEMLPALGPTAPLGVATVGEAQCRERINGAECLARCGGPHFGGSHASRAASLPGAGTACPG